MEIYDASNGKFISPVPSTGGAYFSQGTGPGVSIGKAKMLSWLWGEATKEWP